MNDIAWALVHIMDGIKRHELQEITGLPESDCERLWNATQQAREVLEKYEATREDGTSPYIRDGIAQEMGRIYTHCNEPTLMENLNVNDTSMVISHDDLWKLSSDIKSGELK